MPDFTVKTIVHENNTPKKLTTFDEFNLSTKQRGSKKAAEFTQKVSAEATKLK